MGDKNLKNNDILLSKVKNALGIFTDDQDETINIYIDNIKDFMKSAGVSNDILSSDKATGAIVAGVVDTWQLGGGKISLSPYTTQRIIQLKNEVS